MKCAVAAGVFVADDEAEGEEREERAHDDEGARAGGGLAGDGGTSEQLAPAEFLPRKRGGLVAEGFFGGPDHGSERLQVGDFRQLRLQAGEEREGVFVATGFLVGEAEVFERGERVELAGAGLFEEVEQMAGLVEPAGAEVAVGHAGAGGGEIGTEGEGAGVERGGLVGAAEVGERIAEIGLEHGAFREQLGGAGAKGRGVVELMEVHHLLVEGDGVFRRGIGAELVLRAGDLELLGGLPFVGVNRVVTGA